MPINENIKEIRLYRTASSKFSDAMWEDRSSLTAVSGRWNKEGFYVVYTSENLPLSIFEMSVHVGGVPRVNNECSYSTATITLNDLKDHEIVEISEDDLGDNWKEDQSFTQSITEAFFKNDKPAFILKVPSVVVPESFNYILNPRHSSFQSIQVTPAKKMNIDPRVFSN